MKKNKCTFEWRDNEGRFLQSFNRETKAYSSLKKAKKACAKDARCGAVGLDKIPYRKVPGGSDARRRRTPPTPVFLPRRRRRKKCTA